MSFWYSLRLNRSSFLPPSAVGIGIVIKSRLNQKLKRTAVALSVEVETGILINVPCWIRPWRKPRRSQFMLNNTGKIFTFISINTGAVFNWQGKMFEQDRAARDLERLLTCKCGFTVYREHRHLLSLKFMFFFTESIS